MIAVIFASEREAEPFLKSIDALSVCRRPFLLFKSRKPGVLPCLVAISGIGKVASAVVTVELILVYKAQFVVNAGICGALKDNLPLGLGGMYRVFSAVEGDRSLSRVNTEVSFKCTPFFSGLHEAMLVTSDKVVFDDRLRIDMSLIGDLVDMEGASILRVSSIYGVGCDILKGVTDLADNDGSKTMESNLDEVSEKLSEVILQTIIA